MYTPHHTNSVLVSLPSNMDVHTCNLCIAKPSQSNISMMKNLIHHFPTCCAYSVKKPVGERELWVKIHDVMYIKYLCICICDLMSVN